MEKINHSSNEINTLEASDQILTRLWGKYRFPGKPPLPGSVAEKRLRDVCDRYTNIVMNEDVWKKHSTEDAENFFARPKPSSSDSARRELHNQIAIMVSGTQRSGMPFDLAQKIADFAAEYSRGITFS